jgi:hypothetical protein
MSICGDIEIVSVDITCEIVGSWCKGFYEFKTFDIILYVRNWIIYLTKRCKQRNMNIFDYLVINIKMLCSIKLFVEMNDNLI